MRASVAALFAVVCSFGAANAASLSELRSAAGEIAAELSSARRGDALDIETQKRAIDRLGRLALGFVEVAEGAALSGREKAQRTELRTAYDAVAAPLESIYDTHAGYIDRMVKQIMEEDGDLEALYETEAWRDAQLLASSSLYYLNWLHFYGARLLDGEQSKAMLERAQQGFSQFAVGEQESELQIESLLGRGLCHLELGQYEFAVHDFKLVVESSVTSPQRRSKAKVALVDAHLRAGNIKETLRTSGQFLSAASDLSADEQAFVRFLRARALLQAAKSGGEADRHRRQALAEIERLRARGGAWKTRAEALLVDGVDDPSKWAGKADSAFARWSLARMSVQKQDYAAAMPLLQAILAASDAEAKGLHADAAYLLGLAEFQTGDYRAAAVTLADAQKRAGGEHRAAAAYLRFKALEAAAQQGADAALLEEFRRAADEYVRQYPDHASTYEAHLRLGELLQAAGDCVAAVRAYEQVKGDAIFELRARFATLQCSFEMLAGADGVRPNRVERQKRVGQIASLLSDVQKRMDAAKGQEVEAAAADILPKLLPLEAAYYGLAGGEDERILAALEGYETKYAQHDELFPAVVRQRLEALMRLGRYDTAAVVVQERGEILAADAQRATTESLAKSFLGAAQRAEREGSKAQAETARGVALRLYELSMNGERSEVGKSLTLARLYEEAGEVERARSLYEEVLQGDGDSRAALRGLARIAEQKEELPRALEYWERLLSAARPGDHPWYEGQYEVARLTLATGAAGVSCERLTSLRSALPGLGDPELRGRLRALYEEACR